jgi:hypothetical protein
MNKPNLDNSYELDIDCINYSFTAISTTKENNRLFNPKFWSNKIFEIMIITFFGGLMGAIAMYITSQHQIDKDIALYKVQYTQNKEIIIREKVEVFLEETAIFFNYIKSNDGKYDNKKANQLIDNMRIVYFKMLAYHDY